MTIISGHDPPSDLSVSWNDAIEHAARAAQQADQARDANEGTERAVWRANAWTGIAEAINRREVVAGPLQN